MSGKRQDKTNRERERGRETLKTARAIKLKRDFEHVEHHEARWRN